MHGLIRRPTTPFLPSRALARTEVGFLAHPRQHLNIGGQSIYTLAPIGGPMSLGQQMSAAGKLIAATRHGGDIEMQQALPLAKHIFAVRGMRDADPFFPMSELGPDVDTNWPAYRYAMVNDLVPQMINSLAPQFTFDFAKMYDEIIPSPESNDDPHMMFLRAAFARGLLHHDTRLFVSQGLLSSSVERIYANHLEGALNAVFPGRRIRREDIPLIQSSQREFQRKDQIGVAGMGAGFVGALFSASLIGLPFFLPVAVASGLLFIGSGFLLRKNSKEVDSFARRFLGTGLTEEDGFMSALEVADSIMNTRRSSEEHAKMMETRCLLK